MNNNFRYYVALCLTSLALACGGQVADDGSDENADDARVSLSEPMTWVTMAHKAAEKYTDGSVLMNVEGNIGKGDQFFWYFTFADSKSMYATVQCDGHTATVISHEKRQYIMGVMAIEMNEVKVNFTKLMSIGQKDGLTGRLLHVELAEPLTPNAHPHWTLQQGGKEIMVDAFNGSVMK